MLVIKNSFSKSMRTVFWKMPRSIRDFIINYRGVKKPFRLYQTIKELNQYMDDANNSNLSKSDWQIWKYAFKKHIYSTPENIDIVKSFVTSNIEEVKMSYGPTISSSPILICVVKDDLERMKMLYDHYRSIGIEHFAILDNNSTDGTLEWLLEQDDTDVYLTSDKFESKKKYGWINKIISMYGFNRWYLYVDSDELFVYEDIEKYNIHELLKYAEYNNINRIGALMLDMYSDKPIFKTRKSESILKQYVYFDSDSYTKLQGYKGVNIKGGPRKRMLSYDENWGGPSLIKHPLFNFKPGYIFESAHYLYPYMKDSELLSALLHYKFLESDFERYKKIAEEGNFAEGSKEYRQYMKSFKEDASITFKYDGSVKYTSSASLKEINLMKPIKWNKDE